MYPLNDNDLDRLSRDAAENFNEEPGASGWESLEKRLDIELPREKKRRRFIFWLFFLGIASGSGLIYILNAPNTTNKELLADKQQQVTTASPAGESAGSTDNNVHGHSATKQPANEAGITSSDLSKETSTHTTQVTAPQENQAANAATTTNTTSREQPAATVPAKETTIKTKIPGNAVNKSSGKNTGRPNSAIASNNKKKTSVKTGSKPVEETEEETPRRNYTKTSVTDYLKDTVAEETGNQDEMIRQVENRPSGSRPPDATGTLPPATDTVTDNTTINNTTDSTEISLTTTPAKTKKPGIQHWEIGITGGPDFSYVKFKHSYKTGYILGLQVAYRLNDRWSFNTGLQYTHKNYKANGEDFYAPEHSWIRYVDLQLVEGNCSMFEIPVNVRYDIINGKKSRFFASTGITSYIMTDQNYDYYYIYNNNPGKSNIKIDSTVSYAFKVLNFSAGYEYNFNRHFSIQAEPYLKLPLKGMGYGSMKLESFGVLFGLKYRLGK